MLADAEKDSRILRELRDAPQSIQTLWKYALKNYLKACGAKEFDEALKGAALPLSRAPVVGLQLVSLDETRASCWGLDDNEYSKIENGLPEMCRFGDEDRSTAFSNSLALLHKPIDESYTTSKVWKERVKEFARLSRVIVVSDRYAIRNFLGSNVKDKNVKDKNVKDKSGLGRLLLNISALPPCPKKNVVIFATVDPDERDRPLSSDSSEKRNGRLEILRQEASSQVSSFCDQLRGKSIREVELHLVDDRDFRRVKHYRYLRFDDHHFLQLDKGLAVLEGDQVMQTCPAHLHIWNDNNSKAFRDDEKKVRELPHSPTRIVC